MMGEYDFDTVINRRHTGSVKWDLADTLYGGTGLLPLWVADMDFPSPPEVLAAVHERVTHGVFGYSCCPPAYFDAVAGWFARRHGWAIDKEHILFCPGIVIALNLIIRTFTRPGDGIIIQPPVYHPFRHAIRETGRTVVKNPLVLENGRYRMDLDLLKKQAAQKNTTMLILCSPHNPGGRVWEREELLRLGELCLAHNILVVADEIHCDLVFPGHTHTPFAALTNAIACMTIACTAPSKTFNLAGLQTANLVVADTGRRAQLAAALEAAALHIPNPLGIAASEAAYNHGEHWLEELLRYVHGNLAVVKEYINTHLPLISVIEPEGTYLVWLDCRKRGLTSGEMRKLLVEKGHVALSDGFIFGKEDGDGFLRVNIACPRQTLRAGLERIARALG